MNKHEKLLAASFLERMSEEYGNHGCNDYELPNTPENYAMIQAAELRNSAQHPESVMISPSGLLIWTSDFFVIGYLARLLKEEAA